MSKRTSKYTIEEKVDMIHQVLSDHQSIHSVSNYYQLSSHTIEAWIHRYETAGVDGLKESRGWKHYSEATKISAVNDYLNQVDGQAGICRKYQISSTSVLRQWISKYTGGKPIKATGKGISEMTKGRKTTLRERIEIVQYTLAREKDYYGAAEKYAVSYQQVYSWVKKYESNGAAALEDRRGKKLASKETLTETERLQLEVKELKHRNEYLEAEAGLLKKLNEIERRDPSN